MGVYDGIRKFFGNFRYEVEYEEEEEPEVKEVPEEKEPARPARRKRPIIDIPLDDEKAPEPEAFEEESASSAFPPANVKTPAEVILDEEIEEEEPFEEISPEGEACRVLSFAYPIIIADRAGLSRAEAR